MKTIKNRSFDPDEIGVLCADCGHQTKKSIGWLREHTQCECVGCGTIIDVESKNLRSK